MTQSPTARAKRALDDEAAATPVKAPRKRNSSKKELSVWSRRVHSWTSMVCMLLILFFAVTGLTLNHPSWGADPQTTTATGTLPSEYLADPDYLGISEYLRSKEGVTGTAGEHGVDGTQGRISWAGPSYDATVTFDTATGKYTLTETSYGLIAWFNDLHRGSNTSAAWGWVIDASAILLIAVAVSGLVLQMMIQRRRRTALILLGVGVVATVALFLLH